MTRGDCTRETMARGPACTVELCGCGSLHVTVGALTLRFTPEAAGAFVPTLAEAIERLSLRHARERAPLRLVAARATAGRAGVS